MAVENNMEATEGTKNRTTIIIHKTTPGGHSRENMKSALEFISTWTDEKLFSFQKCLMSRVCLWLSLQLRWDSILDPDSPFLQDQRAPCNHISSPVALEVSSGPELWFQFAQGSPEILQFCFQWYLTSMWVWNPEVWGAKGNCQASSLPFYGSSAYFGPVALCSAPWL